MNKQIKITWLYNTVRTLGFEFGYAPDTFGSCDGILPSTALTDTAHEEFAGVLNTALATVGTLAPIKARRTLAVVKPIFYQKSLTVGTVCEITGGHAISFNTLGGAVAVFTLGTRTVRKTFAPGTSSHRTTLTELFETEMTEDELKNEALSIALEHGTLINVAVFDAPYQSPCDIPTLGLTATFDVSDLASGLSTMKATVYNEDSSVFETVDLSSGYVTLPKLFGTVATLEYCPSHARITAEDVMSPASVVEICPDAEHLLVYLCAALYLADREPELAARYYELYTTYAAQLRADKRGGIYVQRWLADGRLV